MIYVTGDTHGSHDIHKIQEDSWPEGQELTRDDYLVICGDFGAVWTGGPRDHGLLSWYESQPWTTLFVDGNHENHNEIDEYPVTRRFGGNVQVVPGFPHVIHLMRGEVYDLPASKDETVRAFVMGGAPSVDREQRVERISWWAREMPDDEEYFNARTNLKNCNWSVDYVFTHELPRGAVEEAREWDDAVGWDYDYDCNFDYNYGCDYDMEDCDSQFFELSDFLQSVDDRLDRDRLMMWYAGHYHIDAMVVDEQHCVLYQEVVPLGECPSGI